MCGMRRAVFLVALLAAPVLAQGRTFESPQGFRVKVHRDWGDYPLEPRERIVLAGFRLKDSPGRGRTIWIVRWVKGSAPTTGDGEAGEGDKPRSLKDQLESAYNEVHSLQDLLDLRLGKGDYTVAAADRKARKWKDGSAPLVLEARGSGNRNSNVTALLMDDGQEQKGIVALGTGDKAFDEVVEDFAASLEFFQPAPPSAAGGGAAADPELRAPDFRAEVRRKLLKGWDAHDTENFILITNCPNKAVIDKLLVDLEIMRKCYLERFPPVDAMQKVSLVRVFRSYEEYAAYGRLDGAIGHFSPLDDELVLFDPGKKIPKRSAWLKDVDTAEVLYHEAMHQYLHEANGMLAPASWFNEGFGEVFAGAVLDRRTAQVTRIERNRGRMTWIKRSQRNTAWPDLRAFVKMTQPDFYGPSVYQNYAFAWAFCEFLEQHRRDPKGNAVWGGIPDRYLANLREITRKFRDKMPDDAPKDWILAVQYEIQEAAFEQTFAGTDWLALEKAWIEAMKKW
jgi:hypothetical protein